MPIKAHLESSCSVLKLAQHIYRMFPNSQGPPYPGPSVFSCLPTAALLLGNICLFCIPLFSCYNNVKGSSMPQRIRHCLGQLVLDTNDGNAARSGSTHSNDGNTALSGSTWSHTLSCSPFLLEHCLLPFCGSSILQALSSLHDLQED